MWKSISSSIILLILFKSSIENGQAINETEMNKLIETFNGTCNRSDSDCNPMDNISFQNEFNSLPFDVILERMNREMKESGFMAKQFYFGMNSSANPHFPRKLYAQALEKLEKEKILMKFNPKECINSQWFSTRRLFPMHNFYNVYNKFTFPNLAVNNTRNVMTAHQFKWIPTFLFHIYHLNDYFHKYDLLALTTNVDFMLFNFTGSEYEILNYDESIQFLDALKNLAKEGQERFVKAFEKEWGKKKFEFFFGRTFISFDDWLYAFAVLFKRGTFFPINPRDPKTERGHILFPYYHHIPPDPKLKILIDSRRISFQITGKKFGFIAQKNTKKGKEVFSEPMYILNYHYMIYKDYIPKKNENECLQLDMMDKEHAEAWKVKANGCMKVQDMKMQYVIGNLINMEKQELQNCMRMLNNSQSRTVSEQTELIITQCPHPKWSIYDTFEKPLSALKRTKEEFKKSIEKAENMIKIKRNHNVSTFNALIAKEYITDRLTLVEGLADRIVLFKDLNLERQKKEKVEL